MPIVRFKGLEIRCDSGESLRDVLVRAGASPHNGVARVINCRGHGRCGSCAVSVDGDVSAPTFWEKIRLALPPHRRASGLRLACKTRVEGDVTVEKGEGFWGQRPPRAGWTSKRGG